MRSLRVRTMLQWVVLLGLSTMAWADPNPGPVRLWDTGKPIQAVADVATRTAWRALEPNAGARLQGDLVVEAEGTLTVFASARGEVLVLNAAQPAAGGAAVRPVELRGKQATLAPPTVQELQGVVMAQADFRAPGTGRLWITFTFEGNHAVAVRPEGATRGVTVSSALAYAIVPSFVGDDLIYAAKDYPKAGSLLLPSEHWLVGLVKGEAGMLVMTWQEAMPTVRLEITGGGAERSLEGVSFVGGRSFSLSLLRAPGLWHREALKPEWLERDITLPWRRPFPAHWVTQLYEDDLKTTFRFWEGRREHWRGGGIGSYNMPAWFSGETAIFTFGKQIPPQGESVIYFLERNEETPRNVTSPVDLVELNLSGEPRRAVLNVEGRPTWWPMRPDAAISGETCTVTDVLKEVFGNGEEMQKSLFVRGGAEDMVFHLEVLFARNGRYLPFAKDILAYLDAQGKADPTLLPYLRGLRPLPEQMVQVYDDARDTLRDMDYARKLEVETIALTAGKRPNNAQRMLDLKQEWIGMGGAAEDLSRREHTLARSLYQRAAYRAVGSPAAIKVAEEIRRRTKQCLQRPDHYEMWENY